MSGFVSKISAAGSKGWTGLQSLWDRDNKTQLTEPPSGPPPEKTSLLSLALPSRHPRGSRLLSEDDDWQDTPADSSKATTEDSAAAAAASSVTTTSSSTSTSTTTTSHTTPTPTNTSHPLFTPVTTTTTSSPRCRPKAEKPAATTAAAPQPPAKWTSWTSEEETDMWLPDDSAHRGILDTDKKKSTRESKRPSPRFKHKITSSSFSSSKGSGEKGFSALGKLKGPAFGKLLNTDCDEGEMGDGGGSSSTGCENQVWAGDEDDEDAQWRMIEQRAAPKNQ